MGLQYPSRNLAGLEQLMGAIDAAALIVCYRQVIHAHVPDLQTRLCCESFVLKCSKMSGWVLYLRPDMMQTCVAQA